jgi:hypothetical protein
MDIQAIVAEYGVKNVRVFIPLSRIQFAGLIPGIAFRSSGNERYDTECEITEHRYKIADNYKISFKALDEAFGMDSFYQSDFNTLCEQNPFQWRVYVLNGDGYQSMQSCVFPQQSE